MDATAERAEALELVRVHVLFAQDGGVSRDSCWDNLADTLVEMGRADWLSVVEHAFDRAWPM